MTFLEAVNSVLRRLREDEVVSTNSTDYSKLIGDFVNQAIYECEHAWDWSPLVQVNQITTVSGEDSYTFYSTIAFSDVKIFSGINDTKSWMMKVIPKDYQHRLEYLDTPLSDSPYYYSMQGRSANDILMKLYPIPTAVETIQFLGVFYSRDYDLDGTDDSRNIRIDAKPIVLSAYAKAVSERGEDGGLSFSEADAMASNALADAISLDAAKGHPEEVNWNAI